MGTCIKSNIHKVQNGTFDRATTTQERSYTRLQLTKSKRLDQIIISTQIQTLHAVIDFGAGTTDVSICRSGIDQ